MIPPIQNVIANANIKRLWRIFRAGGPLNLRLPIPKPFPCACATNFLYPQKSGHSRFDNPQAGGLLLAFLLLMSLVVAGLSLYTARWAQLYDSQKLRTICRGELSAIYTKVGDKTEDLLALNPKIKALRAEKILAQAALIAAAASGLAPAIKVAQLRLYSVKLRQNFIRARQRYLITTGNALLWTAPRVVFRKLHQSPKALGLVDREIRKQWTPPMKMGVRTADLHPDLPTYELVPDFQRRQTMELKWQSAFAPSNQREARWKITKSVLPESCGMTLKPTSRNRFIAVPMQGKFFWNQ